MTDLSQKKNFGTKKPRKVFWPLAVVHVGVSSPFINDLYAVFLRFSEHQTAFLTACINLKFVVRWRHNIGGNLQKRRKFFKFSQKSL